MSTVRIDYCYVVAGLYGNRMSSVRIDDNSMLCICGQTHKTQKTEKYAFHHSSRDSYRFLRNLHGQIWRNIIKQYVSIKAKTVPHRPIKMTLNEVHDNGIRQTVAGERAYRAAVP